MGKKPVIKVRVYRGIELNYNADGSIKNENHLITIAELIIKRVLQKVVIKKFYKNKENP